MSNKPQTHRERAGKAWRFVQRLQWRGSVPAPDDATDTIAQETFPAELVAAAQEMLKGSVACDRLLESGYGRVDAAREGCDCVTCASASRLRAALAIYLEAP